MYKGRYQFSACDFTIWKTPFHLFGMKQSQLPPEAGFSLSIPDSDFLILKRNMIRSAVA